MDDVCTLMFLGHVSVGKTTLINKILSSFLKSSDRIDILKSHERENTGFIWVLKYGDKLRIIEDQKTEEFESIEDKNFQKKLKELNKIQKKEKNNKVVEVHFPFMPKKLKLIDFPGYSDYKIYESIRDFVKMSEFSHFFILNDCKNPMDQMEYEKKFFQQFDSLIDKNIKTRKNIDFFLMYTKKDEYFKEPNQDKLKKRHKYLIQKVLNMKRMKISIKNVFVLDLTEPMNSVGFLKILQQIDEMIQATPVYKFNYFLNELHSLFATEREESICEILNFEKVESSETKTKHQNDLTQLRISKDIIVAKFKSQMEDMIAEFLQNPVLSEKVTNEARLIIENSSKEVKENRSVFINQVVNNLKDRIYEQLNEKIKILFIEAMKSFLMVLKGVFDPKYIANALHFKEEYFNDLFSVNLSYDVESYICNFFKIPYSNISKLKKKSSFKYKIASLIYDISNKLWTYSGAKEESVMHLKNNLELQREIIINQSLMDLKEILERECEKFENLKTFDEKYAFAKYIICSLEEIFFENFKSEIKKDEKEAIDMLEFEDLYGDCFPDLAENFENEKLKQMNDFLKDNK